MASEDPPPTAALFDSNDLWETSWVEAAGEATLKRRMDVKDPALTLYSSWFCPFAQRAWIAAEESGVNYKWVEINPYYVDSKQPGGYTKKSLALEEKQSMNHDFVQASPRGLVPAIRHKEIVIWESMPVAEYIDAVFGGGKLMKRNDPYEVARQQIWCSHCTDRVQKKYYQALVAQDKRTQQACVDEFFKECRTLARAMSDDGAFFNGKSFSLVDVALTPFWQRIRTVGPYYFGLTFPMEEPEFLRLDRWWKAVEARPSVAATIVCEPRLVSSYADYSKNTATSDAARNYIK